MAEKITAIYDVQIEGMDKVQKSVATTTDLLTDMGKEAKAAFSEDAIDSATASLGKFNTEAEQTVTQFTNVRKEVRELTKQINSGQLSGKALQEATKRAAELTDQLGDTSSAIRRLASDTRVFDTLAEGARGITAGFTLATSASALLGDESQDLQKALLKVQAAQSALLGVQEIANIVTTKGGIATQAYGKAMQAVEFIQKQFAISSAAVFGGIALAIGLAVTAVTLLVNAYDDAQEKGEAYEKYLDEQRAKRLEEDEKNRTDYLARLTKADQDYIKAQEDGAKKSIAAGQNETQVRGALLQERIAAFKAAIETQDNLIIMGATRASEAVAIEEQNAARRVAINEAEIEYQKLVQAEVKRTEDAQKKASDAAIKAREKDLALLNSILGGEPLKTAQLTGEDLVKAIQDGMAAGIDLGKQIEFLKSLGLNDKAILEALKEARAGLEDAPEAVVEIKVVPKIDEQFNVKLQEQIQSTVNQFLSAAPQLAANIFAGQTQKIETEKERQFAILEDDTERRLALAAKDEETQNKIREAAEKKKQKIQQDAAIKSAQLQRKQAIINKTFALVQIAIDTAVSASKAASNPPGLPYTLPFVALAIAQGAIQAALVASQPLPEIPKFKDGVVDFKGRGNETSDSNLVYISNRESVINARATRKNKDALQAINDDKFEDYVYNTILLPALKQTQQVKGMNQTENDDLLPRTIRKGHIEARKNAEAIVHGVVKGLRPVTYFNNRQQ